MSDSGIDANEAKTLISRMFDFLESGAKVHSPHPGPLDSIPSSPECLVLPDQRTASRTPTRPDTQQPFSPPSQTFTMGPKQGGPEVAAESDRQFTALRRATDQLIGLHNVKLGEAGDR